MHATNIMSYKGYGARIEYSAEDECFYGRVLLSKDVILFDATSVEGVKAAFAGVLDDYVAFCRQQGHQPK
ncbi:hypothetical protein IGB42_02664 [Andreprevotia sp. IGB-42]|uniref:hypothetical protein n=1 Tax=Andreprevotia sp. IGB-42 TaxID=2497473 RepID=UPI00157E9F6B|nr:hypothetical protein [Andreprevotia sp. IGB-42]KAF0812821.1 hypothetical protein IGB42_02664 [Andreprevotia sp. IGB-42]